MNRDTEAAQKYPSSPPPSGTFPPEGRLRQPTIHPADLELLTESYQSVRPDGFSPEKSISGQISSLEEWAQAIAGKERTETIRNWTLKGVAFFAAVTTATGGALAMPRTTVAFGIITAIAVAVDAAWPVSGERNARRRAVHDLREIQHTLKLKWEKVRLAHPDPAAIKRIAHALALLDAAQAKREQIGRYLGDASPAVAE